MGLVKCKHHIKENAQECKYCHSWRQQFRNFKKKKVSHLTLYCVQVTHYRTEEWFYKIGVTSQTLDERFDKTRERFRIDPVWEVRAPLYDALVKESQMLYDLQVLQGRRYEPRAFFSGRTECFI